ncbi:Yet1p KNAG_0H00510 [Huiozyma naganishii CBS 8797]|uniref:Endoplasmic reticulum transmembrane protein n=1 Tax=Huiozyma naganishii (strain ATCC MYA-139 / BCRC 22969 / CBS 8797 / KCTC 17520 / NBRC 10181 / NCYC 3082 / Yp74L-3) TaxID=1071383 RepID=J7S1J6_HUIN7|nr:hypothetical protein KNAG_0H00510 [Kazachstania naganishii CBS 8797]CCK71467.1 hypothetical protein KNAG_0H00510 [Kazachstania naganishii CBS 8797]
MSLYFALLFTVLSVEIGVLFLLVCPLPLRVRKLLYRGCQSCLAKQEFRVVASIIGVIVGLLFVDSFKRANVPVNLPRHSQQRVGEPPVGGYDPITSIQALASRSYNQRNAYISGFILYFAVGIMTVMSVVRRVIKYQELINKGEKPVEDTETKELRTVLQQRETDLAALKTQLENNEKFFDKNNEPSETDANLKKNE